MSHGLTQPEEIDHILMMMASHDMEADASIQGATQPDGIVRFAGREKSAAATAYSRCATIEKGTP